MNPSRSRLICLAGALVCGIISVLIAVYFLAMDGSSEASFFGFGFALTLVLLVYFGGGTIYSKFLWHPLFVSKPFLCVLAGVAACVSLLCFASTLSTIGHMDFSWFILALLALSTLSAAACLRHVFGGCAFGWLSLVYSLPIGLLSLAPISYLIFLPSADPVAGAGIGIGILTNADDTFRHCCVANVDCSDIL